MIWTYTPRVGTQVIDLEPFRYRPHLQLIGYTMSHYWTTQPWMIELSVAKAPLKDAGSPDPATVCLLNLGPEELFDCLRCWSGLYQVTLLLVLNQ